MAVLHHLNTETV